MFGQVVVGPATAQFLVFEQHMRSSERLRASIAFVSPFCPESKRCTVADLSHYTIVATHLCVCSCARRLLRSANRRPHSTHSYGRSPATCGVGVWCAYRTCVRPQMPLQEPGPRECLTTLLAHTGRRVRPLVHLECARGPATIDYGYRLVCI